MRTEKEIATYHKRQLLISELLEKNRSEALLVSHIPHIRYLTGFSGSTALLLVLRGGKTKFLTDFRYHEQAGEELKPINHLEIIIIKNDYILSFCDCLRETGVKKCSFQPDRLNCHQYGKIKKTLPALEMDTIGPELDFCFQIKDEWEIEWIAKAAQIADSVFPTLLENCRKDFPEKEIAARLDFEGRLAGSDGPAFPTIIASGKNGALPHALATDKKPQTGDMIVADYGMIFNGYCSDMTRSFCLGKAGEKLKEIYEIVLKAQETALKAIKPGVPCKEVDAAARTVIADAGYGEYFGHGLGHGVGIEVHEGPRLSANSTDVCKSGMVFTVEPGIYLPGTGGVRIEDMITVTEDGYRNLVNTGKELLELF